MTRRRTTPRNEPLPDFWQLKQAASEALETLETVGQKKIVRHFVYAAGPERYANLGMQYAKERRIEPQTLTEARSQLKNIVRHGGALLDVLRRTRGATVTALNDMRGVAIDIGFRPATLGQLETELEWLVQAAERASRLPEVKDHKGPARQRSAREVARHAADDFYAITGKKPTRNTFMKAGGFGEFRIGFFVRFTSPKEPRPSNKRRSAPGRHATPAQGI